MASSTVSTAMASEADDPAPAPAPGKDKMQHHQTKRQRRNAARAERKWYDRTRFNEAIKEFCISLPQGDEKEERRVKAQYFDVAAAMKREAEAKKRLNGAKNKFQTQKQIFRHHQEEIHALEARSIEDERTIAELRKELRTAQKELRLSKEKQMPPEAALDEASVQRDGILKRRKAKKVIRKAERNALRQELQESRNELKFALETVVDHEGPHLLGVFKIMRNKIEELQAERDALLRRHRQS